MNNEFIISPVKKIKYLIQIKNVKWMNPRAKANEAYVPTYIEHFANIITHGIWILPALFCSIELLKRSKNWNQEISAWVYGISLILVFTISTIFHCFHCCNKKKFKDVLHRCDRAIIYIFIAATYYPWLMIQDFSDDFIIPTMKYFIWVMAFLGILYQQIFHERYKQLEIIFYLLMGIVPSTAFLLENKIEHIWQLKTGGLIYVAGLIFFKSDGRIPFAHAIWHLFVTAAAGTNYYATIYYLYPFSEKKDNLQHLEL